MAEAEVGIRLSLKDRQKVARGLTDTRGGLDQVADSAQDVGKAGDEAARGLAKASDSKFARGFVAIGRGARGLASVVGRGLVTAAKAGVVGLTGLAVAAGALSVKATGLAGDAAETASAFNTVFGPAAKGLQKQLDGITKRFGIYNPELQDAARQFGVFGKVAKVPQKELAKFSTSLVRAGLDLSSFYNVDAGQVFENLQSGLSGETEPLRKFGIFINETAVTTKAAAMGIKGELTDQQKIMVRQAIIMEQLGDAQGDLRRTSQGYANQLRESQGRTKSFVSLLGGPMKTAMTGALKGFNSVAKVGVAELQKRIPGLNKSAESMSQRFERWGDVIAKKLPGWIDTGAAKWDTFKSKLDSLKGNGVSLSLGQIGDAFSKIGTALSGADWGKVGENLDSTAADTINVFGVAVGFAADHIDTLSKYLPLLVAGFVAYKAAQALANLVALASVPIKIAEIMATRAHTAALRANTATAGAQASATAAGTAASNASLLTRIRTTTATIAGTVAEKARTAAVKAGTVAQKALNLVMRMNPLGLVITAITLLVGGFILLYKKSDTFRGMIDGLWNNVLKPFGAFLGKLFVGYIKTVAKAFLSLGIFGVRAFRTLLGAAFSTFDGILSAAEKGLGWIPGIGDKISGARRAFNKFGEATIAKLKGVEDKLVGVRDKVDGLDGKKATITVSVRMNEAPMLDALAAGNFIGGSGPNAPQMDPIEFDPQRRAKGGPVRAGHTYLVGERGVEAYKDRHGNTQPVGVGGMQLFTAPADGTIVPNHRLTAPRVTQAPQLPSMSARDIESSVMAGTDDSNWSMPPIHVTTHATVMVDGKVLTETVLDGAEARAARR